MMKHSRNLVLSVMSGALLSLAWLNQYTLFLLFVALIPLLLLEDEYTKKTPAIARLGVFKYSLLAFFIWNVFTTWWIGYSTIAGAVLAIGLNSLFMTAMFTLAHFVKRSLTNQKANIAVFIAFWLSFEFCHHYWQLSWPWLSLGNAFGSNPLLVQWYEYTGMFGGSLWVLLVNGFLFLSIRSFQHNSTVKQKLFTLSLTGLILVAPIVVSLFIYHNYQERGTPIEVVVVQPNKDPWSEQYNLSSRENTGDIITLFREAIDSSTQLLVAPESALYNNIWENQFQYSTALKMLDTFLAVYPKASCIIGASTLRMYRSGKGETSTARSLSSDDSYDAYNSAFLLQYNRTPLVRHKSKLVPGVEFMPFNSVMKHIQKFVFDLGGMTGTLGVDSMPVIFKINDSLSVASIICFESVYSEYVAQFVRDGAQLIAVITNDGWWSDSPGHVQHFRFSRLRAIETRRTIARSANTGISAFINQRGDVLTSIPYAETGVIKECVLANSEKTFFVNNGDIVGRPALFITVLLFLLAVIKECIPKR